MVGKVVKGILWQFYKLGLKVPSGRDKNDGISHLAELGSRWPGEAKTWPKIALRVGGRAENCVLGDVLEREALFLETFWALLASWSRVRKNDLYHRFCLGQTELLSQTCKIATGSLGK